MGELSVRISDESIIIDGEMPITLPKRWLHPELVTAFCKANYNMQGTVSYQSWLAGVFAGLALVIGPDGIPFSSGAIVGGTGELTGDGTGQAAAELQQSEMTEVTQKRLVPDGNPIDLKTPAVASEETRGLTPPGSPVVSETIVPTAETPAAVGETIVPVSESPAAVASPEASGAVSP